MYLIPTPDSQIHTSPPIPYFPLPTSHAPPQSTLKSHLSKQHTLWKPISLAFSRKHRRQMSSEYLRMSPILAPQTRQQREPLP